MAQRTERCSGCFRLLLLPFRATTACCAVCGKLIAPRFRAPVQQQKVNRMRGLTRSALSSSSQFNMVPPYDGSSTTTSPSYPLGHSKRKALLIGVTYKGTGYQLEGSVNDVKCMKFFLQKYGFSEEYIVVLTEEGRDPCWIPTRQNMLAAMQWLVHDCRAGDSLVFHFSGHGSQQLDTSGDDIDGFDETVCPVDFNCNGMITDDEINNILVRPLPDRVKLHAVIDSCHSGTVMDLPYQCRINRMGYFQWKESSLPSCTNKGTSGGLVISFSGCDDHQKSVDTSAFSGKTMTGAMTFAFIQSVESDPGGTYGSLLLAMRATIRDANAGSYVGGPIASLMKKVFQSGWSQEPQLCSSEIFDVFKRPFII